MNKIEIIEKDNRKLNVCGYARVSTTTYEQDSSYELQITELIDEITSNSEYNFVNVFFDKATGTNQERTGFKTMLELAHGGMIDLILVKSITRFGRNTTETLTTVKELKEIGVGVIFMKENINSLESINDFIFNILSSHAEEESKNISSNNKWNITKRMEQGANFTVRLYGYDIKDNVWTINKEEAKVVRKIYELYLDKVPMSGIIKYLQDNGIKTINGNDRWNHTTIERMLTQEKYIGNVRLQKTITVLHKSRYASEYDTKYFIKGNHPAILSEEVFEQAQALRTSRRFDRSLPFTKQSETNSKAYLGFVYSEVAKHDLAFIIDKHGKYVNPILYYKATTNNPRVSIHVKYLFQLLSSACFDLKRRMFLFKEISYVSEINKLTKQISGLGTSISDLEIKASYQAQLCSFINFQKTVKNIRKHLPAITNNSNINDYRQLFQKVIMKADNEYDLYLSSKPTTIIHTLTSTYERIVNQARPQIIECKINICF
jgi:DNA invertase Pin-like site-specific DNA recombinase